MYEIGDITDKEAENYLVQVGVEPEKAKKLVVHLCTSVALLGRYTGDGYCEAITFPRDLYAQCFLIEKLLPKSEIIIQKLCEQECLILHELIKDCPDDGQRIKLEDIVAEMESTNILRYTVGGKVTWHGRIQKYELGDCSEQTSA